MRTITENARRCLQEINMPYSFCDEVAMGVELSPEIILKSKKVRASVELRGEVNIEENLLTWKLYFTSKTSGYSWSVGYRLGKFE